MSNFTKFYDGYSEVIKSMKPKEGEAPEAAPSYHNRIMNIPEGGNEPYTAKPLYGYSYGHRDARHAAAEIAGEADRRIEELERRLVEANERTEETEAKLRAHLAVVNAFRTECEEKAGKAEARAAAALGEREVMESRLREAERENAALDDKIYIAPDDLLATVLARAEAAEQEAERAGRDFQVARDAFDRAEAEAARLRSAGNKIIAKAEKNAQPRGLEKHFKTFRSITIQLLEEDIAALRPADQPDAATETHNQGDNQ